MKGVTGVGNGVVCTGEGERLGAGGALTDEGLLGIEACPAVGDSCKVVEALIAG